MSTPMQAALEAMARDLATEDGEDWHALLASQRAMYVGRATTAFTALAAHLDGDLMRAVEGWRDIATAPRDGQHVLVTATNTYGAAFVVAAYYCEGREGWWEANTHWTDSTGEVVGPTHWMPFPKAPRHE
jgi:hypothetical protein